MPNSRPANLANNVVPDKIDTLRVSIPGYLRAVQRISNIRRQSAFPVLTHPTNTINRMFETLAKPHQHGRSDVDASGASRR